MILVRKVPILRGIVYVMKVRIVTEESSFGGGADDGHGRIFGIFFCQRWLKGVMHGSCVDRGGYRLHEKSARFGQEA